MGLDMYFIRVKAEDALDDFTVKHEENYISIEAHTIHYYRKFFELNDFMCKLYHRKNNSEIVDHDDLNCAIMRITTHDLDELLKWRNKTTCTVTRRSLDKLDNDTKIMYETHNIDDLIEKIYKVWESGDSVYYFPSW